MVSIAFFVVATNTSTIHPHAHTALEFSWNDPLLFELIAKYRWSALQFISKFIIPRAFHSSLQLSPSVPMFSLCLENHSFPLCFGLHCLQLDTVEFLLKRKTKKNSTQFRYLTYFTPLDSKECDFDSDSASIEVEKKQLKWLARSLLHEKKQLTHATREKKKQELQEVFAIFLVFLHEKEKKTYSIKLGRCKRYDWMTCIAYSTSGFVPIMEPRKHEDREMLLMKATEKHYINENQSFFFLSLFICEPVFSFFLQQNAWKKSISLHFLSLRFVFLRKIFASQPIKIITPLKRNCKSNKKKDAKKKAKIRKSYQTTSLEIVFGIYIIPVAVVCVCVIPWQPFPFLEYHFVVIVRMKVKNM